VMGTRSGDLDPSLVTIGEILCKGISPALKPGEAQDPSDFFVSSFLLTLCSGGPKDRTDPGGAKLPVQTYEDIFQGGHVCKQPNVLVGAGDAKMGDPVWAQVVDRMAIEYDLPLINWVETRNTVEERRLPCSVRANNACDRVLFNFEVQRVECNEAPESFGYVARS